MLMYPMHNWRYLDQPRANHVASTNDIIDEHVGADIQRIHHARRYFNMVQLIITFDAPSERDATARRAPAPGGRFTRGLDIGSECGPPGFAGWCVRAGRRGVLYASGGLGGMGGSAGGVGMESVPPLPRVSAPGLPGPPG